MANKITVTSQGTTANVNATPDSAMYYSNKSKEWAISNKIVDNTDYSSKYYANESKKQADISTAKTTEVVESGNTAVSNIESARDNAITNITNQENVSVDNVNTAGAMQVANVNSAGTTQVNLAKEQVVLATNQANVAKEQATIATNKTSEVVASGNEALSNIDTAKTGAITDITDLKNDSISSMENTKSETLTEIETLHTSSVDDITNLKNTSVSNITTAKNNAITSITTQETTSKNNIITTGNEQVERIHLAGIDNKLPMFTKGEKETNESVYKNVYDMKHSTFDKSKFTVIGSPTITDDGVASGFSSSNYLNIPNIDVTNKEFEIDLGKQLTPPSFITSSYMISGQSSRQDLFSIGIRNGSIFAGCNGIYFNGIFPDYLLQTNTYYWIKGGVKDNLAYLMISTDGINYATYTYTLTNTYTSLNLRVGYSGDNNPSLAYNGSIDLKQFSITVDGKEVFSGNKTGIDVINDIEIPYTESKTGSKIVDVAYRDRVIDLYEQEGQAGYYTIDEENQNFTLPIGEVYGMIESKADLDAQNLSAAGKSLISGAGMPSNRYIDLTLGASGSNYTAPANGWFFIRKQTGNPGFSPYLAMTNVSAGLLSTENRPGGTGTLTIQLFIPAKRGDIVTVYYDAIGTTLYFRFIYAEGSK